MSQESCQDEIREGLRPYSSNAERTRALIAAGLSIGGIAKVTGANSPSTLRNWQVGQTQPRREAARILDELRCVMARMIDGGMSPEAGAIFLESRQETETPPVAPIDIIAEEPDRVLDMADRAIEHYAAQSTQP